MLSVPYVDPGDRFVVRKIHAVKGELHPSPFSNAC